MSTNPPQKCKNCGYDRAEHSFDDGCWAELQSGGRVRLCSCPGFELMKPKPRRKNPPSRMQSDSETD